VKIDMSDNAVGDTVIVREYERIIPGGGWVKVDQIVFAGVQSLPMKHVKLEPNRSGVKVTLESASGQDYDWEVLYSE